jgi:hypothetical protein
VGPRAGLDDVEKIKFFTLPGLELRPLDRPARSQSLYRLSYPGSHFFEKPQQTPEVSVRTVDFQWSMLDGSFRMCQPLHR